MQHLCFFLYHKSNTYTTRSPPAKDSFSFKFRNHNSVKIRHKQAATLRILR